MRDTQTPGQGPGRPKATTPVTPVPRLKPAVKATPAPCACVPAKNPAKDPPGTPPTHGPAHVTELKPEEKRPVVGLNPVMPSI